MLRERFSGRVAGRPTVVDTFLEIIDPADPVLETFWLPLYRTAFPDDERVPEQQHLNAVSADHEHVVVGFNDDRPVAMARYDVLEDSAVGPFAYLMYMAVDRNASSRGHGQQMFAE